MVLTFIVLAGWHEIKIEVRSLYQITECKTTQKPLSCFAPNIEKAQDIVTFDAVKTSLHYVK